MTRRSSHIGPGAVLAALGLALLGGCGSDASTAEPEPAEAADPDSPTSPPAAPGQSAPGEPSDASSGEARATVVLDGITYEFTNFAQCLSFGPRFMSALARNDDGAELSVSYELPDFAEDGESSEYVDELSLEPPGGQERWEASVATTSSGVVIIGELDMSREGDTLTISGTAENMFSPTPRATADMEATISC
jgi:hypothetical protein